MDLLSRLSGNSKPLPIEPREIFMSYLREQKVMSIPEMFSLRFGKNGLMLEMIKTASSR